MGEGNFLSTIHRKGKVNDLMLILSLNVKCCV